jgi:ABC-type Fe3+-citrate transport system substrate-binding protein
MKVRIITLIITTMTLLIGCSKPDNNSTNNEEQTEKE